MSSYCASRRRTHERRNAPSHRHGIPRLPHRRAHRSAWHGRRLPSVRPQTEANDRAQANGTRARSGTGIPRTLRTRVAAGDVAGAPQRRPDSRRRRRRRCPVSRDARRRGNRPEDAVAQRGPACSCPCAGDRPASGRGARRSGCKGPRSSRREAVERSARLERTCLSRGLRSNSSVHRGRRQRRSLALAADPRLSRAGADRRRRCRRSRGRLCAGVPALRMPDGETRRSRAVRSSASPGRTSRRTRHVRASRTASCRSRSTQ
jgi:hypothetical protein